jgi:hypothetical protein
MPNPAGIVSMYITVIIIVARAAQRAVHNSVYHVHTMVTL